jgi:hypothetical protein
MLELVIAIVSVWLVYALRMTSANRGRSDNRLELYATLVEKYISHPIADGFRRFGVNGSDGM